MTTDAAGDSGTVSSTTDATAAFTNVRPSGDLVISKTVESPFDEDQDEEFTFSVYLYDESGYNTLAVSKTFDALKTESGSQIAAETGVSFTNGVAALSLKGGETVTIQALPEGVNFEVLETPVTGYSSEPMDDDGYISVTGTIDSSEEASAEFTNTRETVSFPITKVWVGEELDSVVINIMNGEEVFDEIEIFPERRRGKTEWTTEYTGPKYDADGNEIEYSVEEPEISGYESSVEGDVENGFTVTNTSTDKINVKVTKVWVGPEGESATVELIDTADAKPTALDTAELTEDGDWSATFSNLPKYDEDGNEIAYGVQEQPIEDYRSEVSGTIEDGFTVTNTNISITDITVKKVWVGPEGDSVTVNLMQTGMEAPVDSCELSADGKWTHTFEGLRLYDDEGNALEYYVDEIEIDNYDSEIEGDIEQGFTITNTNNETVSFPITKVWVGESLDKVTVNVLADKKPYEELVIEPQKVRGGIERWEVTFQGPKYDEQGNEIVYTVEEPEISGYLSSVEGDMEQGFIVTNTCTETVEFDVSKTWIGPEGEGAEISVFAEPLTPKAKPADDGTAAGADAASKPVAVRTITADDQWSCTFVLPKYDENGDELIYWIEETPVENYAAEIEGDMEDGFVITNTNTETVDISVRKVWLGDPAESVTISLKDGDEYLDNITIGEEDGWKGSFDDLPRYDIDGREIVYSVEEDEIEGYTATYSGNAEDDFVITNFNGESIQIEVNKIWVGPAKDSVTVTLSGNGNNYTVTFGEKDDWTATFTVPKFESSSGAAIVYTLGEFAVEGYESEIEGDAEEGFTITNTYEPGDFTVTYKVDGKTVGDVETYSYGDTVTVRDRYEKEGYIVTDWSSDDADVSGKTFTMPDHDVLIEAESSIEPEVTLTYESNGGTKFEPETYRVDEVAALTRVPKRQGYTFTGWHSDPELTDKIDEIFMDSDKTVYAGWKKTPVPVVLNGEDHFAYIIGYVDGNVKPDGSITRAEVATVFFRLLKDKVRDGNLTYENSFYDVEEGMWFNTAISTLEKLGIVNGYADGGFHPDDAITRAEFTKMAAMFDDREGDKKADFSDISEHWASDEISKAAANGWVDGYEDGTFLPDARIRRCEAMAIINRVLGRLPQSKKDLLEDMVEWPDNMDESKWFYLHVQEATNSHECERRANGTEYWTKLTEVPDWTRYER
jgi:uncharacterized repeat protein (TIGR02543 family)